MAALLSWQRLLKEKHALEEQQGQIRKQKQLKLEADIAASMAKVNVLRTSGASVRSASSRKLDGMASYFEKRLNIQAEPFVPYEDERDAIGPLPEVRSLHPCFGGARSKQHEGANYVRLSKRRTQMQIGSGNDRLYFLSIFSLQTE